MADERDADVIVVGAGIAGLAGAFRLRQAGLRVRVLERTDPDRVGGRMATVERDGFLRGPWRTTAGPALPVDADRHPGAAVVTTGPVPAPDDPL